MKKEINEKLTEAYTSSLGKSLDIYVKEPRCRTERLVSSNRKRLIDYAIQAGIPVEVDKILDLYAGAEIRLAKKNDPSFRTQNAIDFLKSEREEIFTQFEKLAKSNSNE